MPAHAAQKQTDFSVLNSADPKEADEKRKFILRKYINGQNKDFSIDT